MMLLTDLNDSLLSIDLPCHSDLEDALNSVLNTEDDVEYPGSLEDA